MNDGLAARFAELYLSGSLDAKPYTGVANGDDPPCPNGCEPVYSQTPRGDTYRCVTAWASSDPEGPVATTCMRCHTVVAISEGWDA